MMRMKQNPRDLENDKRWHAMNQSEVNYLQTELVHSMLHKYYLSPVFTECFACHSESWLILGNFALLSSVCGESQCGFIPQILAPLTE